MVVIQGFNLIRGLVLDQRVGSADHSTDYRHSQQPVTASDRLSIHLSSGGGWTAIVR